MQSSLLNKSSNSFQGSPGNKMNLLGKFALLEELTYNIEGETSNLTASAKVSNRLFRSRQE